MFYYCISLEYLDISNFDTSKVTNFFEMFYGCSNLKSINLSNFNTSNAKNMVGMFMSCISLEYLDISNFDTTQVTKFQSIFDNTNILKYINLYNAQIDAIKSEIETIIDESTMVCQKTDNNKITDKGILRCCDYNLKTQSCPSII